MKEGGYSKTNWSFGLHTMVMQGDVNSTSTRYSFVSKNRIMDLNFYNCTPEAQKRFLSSLVINGEHATTTPLADNLVWDWPEAKKK